MSSKIKIYKGTVTAGQTDGDPVSSNTGLSPIESGAIKAPETGYQEGQWIKLAARCDEGYKTKEESSRHARISIVDLEEDNEDKWQLALDDNDKAGIPEDWGNPLDIISQIDDTNTIFWAKARVDAGEEPMSDMTVQLEIQGTIEGPPKVPDSWDV